jgi:hypothetical protein
MNGSMEEMFLAQLAKRLTAGENKKKPCQPPVPPAFNRQETCAGQEKMRNGSV